MMKNIRIRELIEEYAPSNNIFTDDDNMTKLKTAIASLPQADRIIFLLYVEFGSLRKVGKYLGVSHTTIFKTINQIKKKIYDSI